MSDRDRRVQLPYPLERWHHHQGRSNDCGPYCVSIVSNALGGTSRAEAQSVAEEMARWDRRSVPERIAGWATFPWGVARALRRRGLQARWRIGQRPERLLADLEAGVVPIVIVGDPLRFKEGRWRGWSHYKVLCAWDPDRGWGFVDPAAEHAGGFVWQSDDAFRSQWKRMGRQIVEVRKAQGE